MRTYIDMINEIEGHLIDNKDGHGQEHASDVFNNMLEYYGSKNIPFKPGLLMLAALAHDMYVDVDRVNHHILAAEYLEDNRSVILETGFSNEEIDDLVEAVKHHRASNDEELNKNNILLSAIRIADKGKPDLENVIKRSIKYYTNNIGDNDVATNVYKHIKEKFSRTGYGMQDEEYRKYYNEELEIFWNKIDELTKEDVEKIVTELKNDL